jgi:hypothetical protein
MPTENRRVATYLPKEIDDRLKAFIAERQLKGDSQALIVILSEFLGVALPVAQKVDYSGFVKSEEFNELLVKVSELSAAVESKSPGAILNKLLERVDRLEKLIGDQELKQPQTETQIETIPGQMNLLEVVESELSENLKSSLLESSSPVSAEKELKLKADSSSLGEPLRELKPMTGIALSKRFGLSKDSVAGSKKSRTKEQFLQWLREKDPDGIAWQYNLEDKLYHPLIERASSQVSPLPAGSQRSEEG